MTEASCKYGRAERIATTGCQMDVEHHASSPESPVTRLVLPEITNKPLSYLSTNCLGCLLILIGPSVYQLILTLLQC